MNYREYTLKGVKGHIRMLREKIWGGWLADKLVERLPGGESGGWTPYLDDGDFGVEASL